MSDRTVTLSFEVPEEVVREAQMALPIRAKAADRYRREAKASAAGGCWDDALGELAVAAALEVELPPERKPVTPETPWGTVIAPGPKLSVPAVLGRRKFVGAAPDDPERFIYFSDSTAWRGRYDDGWYEVKRP